MRIDGFRPVGKLKKQIAIARPDQSSLSLNIQALPFGFEEIVLSRLPMPAAPKVFVTKGGRIQYDANGKAAETRDTDDVDYRKRAIRMTFLQTVAGVVEALKADEKVHWEAQEPKSDESREWERFYTAAFEEMKAFGLTPGDVKAIMTEVSLLSGLKDGELEAEQKRSFLRIAPGTSAGSPGGEPETSQPGGSGDTSRSEQSRG